MKLVIKLGNQQVAIPCLTFVKGRNCPSADALSATSTAVVPGRKVDRAVNSTYSTEDTAVVGHHKAAAVVGDGSGKAAAVAAVVVADQEIEGSLDVEGEPSLVVDVSS